MENKIFDGLDDYQKNQLDDYQKNQLNEIKKMNDLIDNLSVYKYDFIRCSCHRNGNCEYSIKMCDYTTIDPNNYYRYDMIVQFLTNKTSNSFMINNGKYIINCKLSTESNNIIIKAISLQLHGRSGIFNAGISKYFMIMLNKLIKIIDEYVLKTSVKKEVEMVEQETEMVNKMKRFEQIVLSESLKN